MVLGHRQVGVKTQCRVEIEGVSLFDDRLGGSEEESPAGHPDKIAKDFLEIDIQRLSATETQRDGELGPDDQSGAVGGSPAAEFEMTVEQLPDLFTGDPVPIDVPG
jgi:hypothetical protein